MFGSVHLFYEWFKNRNWVVWFTQWYECNWRSFFERVANGHVEESKKLVQLALVIYGLIELFVGGFTIKLLSENQSYPLLFPACVVNGLFTKRLIRPEQ